MTEISKSFLEIYNEYNETQIGEDIPDQARSNIGIYFKGEEKSIRVAKSFLEKITDVCFVEGETTKLMKERGIN